MGLSEWECYLVRQRLKVNQQDPPKPMLIHSSSWLWVMGTLPVWIITKVLRLLSINRPLVTEPISSIMLRKGSKPILSAKELFEPAHYYVNVG